MKTPIILAYRLYGDGTASALSGEAISEGLKDDQLAWVHMDAGHEDTAPWLSAELDYLDPFVISALTADETRPRMTQVGEGAIVILRGVNLNAGASQEDMVSIRLFIDSHRIISLQMRDVKAVGFVENNIRAGRAPNTAGDFLCQLISHLTGRFESVLSALDDLTDDAEETLLTRADTGLRQDIINIRKQAIVLRRHMSPQREAISQLRMAELDWLSEVQKRSLQESYNHVLRYVEELDAIRERAQIVKDELANMIADRLNKNTYILSVIAAIFLPLGFLTGLLGVNIGGIPGVNSPIAFAVFCLLLTILVAVQVIIFRKLKWF
jgi:zinc transporter